MRTTKSSAAPSATMRLRRSTIELFVSKIRASLPARIEGWEAPLAMLLASNNTSPSLETFANHLRALARTEASDDDRASALIDAVQSSSGDLENGAFLAPLHAALLATACVIARRALLIMDAWRLFASVCSATRRDYRLPVDWVIPEPRSPLVRVVHADTVLSVAVARAVEASLRQAASSSSLPFQDWSCQEREAALSALWLAYAETSTGTAGRHVLTQAELAKDFRRCGRQLWQMMLAGDEYTDGLRRLRTVWSATQMARLEVILGASAEAIFDGDNDAQIGNAAAVADKRPATLVVCRRSIAPSSDKSDRDEIARHRVLETPLPLAGMPSVERLRLICSSLKAEFPWAEEVLQTFFEDLIGKANLGVKALRVPATLLVGVPGSGKSRLARRIAEELGMPRLDVSLSGSSDSKVLAGTSRGWASGQPSELARLLASQKVASAMVLLDELDKARGTTASDGGVQSYLLSLLEPETANRHYDSFLKTECDFTGVSWVCTANRLSTLDAPLRSRLRILYVPPPSCEHFETVAENVLRERTTELGVPSGVLPELQDLRLRFDSLSNVRQVRAAVEASLTVWSSRIVKH